MNKNSSYTYDNEEQFHSYDDLPATGQGDARWTKIWFNHGVVNRNNDKPAIIIPATLLAPERSYWYKDGLIHRDNDKPAEVEGTVSTWRVFNVLHRSHSPSSVEAESNTLTYALYGIVITEDEFKDITSYVKETGCPLWVVWMKHLGLINHEDLHALYMQGSLKENVIPESWLIRSLKINPTDVSNMYKKLLSEKANKDISGVSADEAMETILKIYNYENSLNR